jgi:hypothetical protein
MSVWKAILLFILFGALVVSIVFVVLNIKKQDTDPQNLSNENDNKNKSRLNSHKSQLNSNDINSPNISNYISPHNFHIGDLQKPQPLSNMCKPDGVMYPINGLSPKYSPFKTCNSCTQYLQPP